MQTTLSHLHFEALKVRCPHLVPYVEVQMGLYYLEHPELATLPYDSANVLWYLADLLGAHDTRESLLPLCREILSNLLNAREMGGAPLIIELHYSRCLALEAVEGNNRQMALFQWFDGLLESMHMSSNLWSWVEEQDMEGYKQRPEYYGKQYFSKRVEALSHVVRMGASLQPDLAGGSITAAKRLFLSAFGNKALVQITRRLTELFTEEKKETKKHGTRV